MTIFKQHYL